MTTEPNTTQTGRCKTCKHWERYTNAFEMKYYGTHAGKCGSKKFLYDGQVTLQDGLSYWDHEDYGAGFNTGEDFGCVHWVAA